MHLAILETQGGDHGFVNTTKSAPATQAQVLTRSWPSSEVNVSCWRTRFLPLHGEASLDLAPQFVVSYRS